MAEWTRGAKVGLFAVATAAAGYGIWQFVNPSAGSADGYAVYAYLNDASGLASYSRVMIAGIPVGNIESIKLEGRKARVNLRIKPDVQLQQNAILAKRSSSLLGEFILDIDPGDQPPPLRDGDQIKYVSEPATTDKIMRDLSEIADEVKVITGSLAKTVGSEQGQQDIQATLHNLAQVTDELNRTVRENRASIRQIVSNVENISGRSEPQIAQILDNVRVITSEVRTLVAESEGLREPGVPGEPGAAGEPSAGSLRHTMARLNDASLELKSALTHIDNIAGRIDRGEGTIGRLTTDETIINEVNNVVEGVGDLVGGIARTQTIIGLRNDYNFQSNTIKSYVELRLQPREDKYYLIQLINDPRGLTSFEQIDVDTTNPNQPPHYREIRTVTTDAFRFSFQFARRLGPFTGRFGIMESTGGVGLDVHLLQDRFELAQDLFGFGEQLQPRWRVALHYELIRRLWLISGADNILTNDRRDYFLGLQLRFVDDDLKSILPFAPSL